MPALGNNLSIVIGRMPGTPPEAPIAFFLLLETGDFFLLENDDKLIL